MDSTMQVRLYIRVILVALLFAALVYAFRYVSSVLIWYSGIAFLQAWSFHVVGLATVGVLLGFSRLRRRARALEVAGATPWMLLGGLLALAPVLVVIDVLTQDLGPDVDLPNLISPTAVSVALAVLMGVTAALWEETWRAITVTLLGGRRRPFLAIGVSSLLFGLIHATALSWSSLMHVFNTTLVGIVFSSALLLGARLWHVIAVHAAYDVVLFSVLPGDYFDVLNELDKLSLGELGVWAWLSTPLFLGLATGAIALVRRRLPELREMDERTPARPPTPVRAREFVPAVALILILTAVVVDWFGLGGPLTNRALKECIDHHGPVSVADDGTIVRDDLEVRSNACRGAQKRGDLSIYGYVEDVDKRQP